jgi:uncharacterized protein with HEPN domain
MEIAINKKLVDLLKLSKSAYEKLEGLKYRKYYKNVKLQLELIDFYKILVDYGNQLPVSYKENFKDVIFSNLDELEATIFSEDFGINEQWIWEMTINDLPKFISYLQEQIIE